MASAGAEHRPGERHGISRECVAHHAEDLEREAYVVLKAAAVNVFALVRQRREELVQQMAVRGMQLETVETEPGGAPPCFGKGIAHVLQALASSAEGASSNAVCGTAESARTAPSTRARAC